MLVIAIIPTGKIMVMLLDFLILVMEAHQIILMNLIAVIEMLSRKLLKITHQRATFTNKSNSVHPTQTGQSGHHPIQKNTALKRITSTGFTLQRLYQQTSRSF